MSLAMDWGMSQLIVSAHKGHHRGVVVELPIKTVAGLNAREHWRNRAKRVRGERDGVRAVLRCNPAVPELPVIVTMTRLSAGTLDGDNLQGAFKAIRDGVADAYGIPDNDPRVTWRYAQEKCKAGKYGIRIQLEAT